MNRPEILKGDSLKRLLQGTAFGAVATLIVGFGFGGWMLGGSARILAAEAASKAMVAAIAPICVDQFQRSADATTNMVELKKINPWQQATFVEKGGWAVMPGSTAGDASVAKACATMLNELK